MAPPQAKKKSQGRRKIDMKLIADENARTVTFSKRRAGLFKKATELSVLCGTQIALIIFSLGGRAYSFGHPDVESIVGRFFNRNPTPTPQESAHAMRIRASMLQEIKAQFDQKSEELETKKKRTKEIEAALESSSYQTTEEGLDGLDIHQLQQLKEKMVRLREQVRRLANAPRANAVVAPAVPGPVGAKPARSVPPLNLAKVRKNEVGASSIPPDWLKL
ncbi:agamous-like MADS-box protein AGL62 [Salvia miltiorrhiza]|uniref:agamous-like MADS-box protein AGL62 n=1 Tax=Salvia miltiorrhiza TaxID=226208 RepID=UPI0025ACE336|nr:agamous-like MADS-box protein AGL62 [Salvia miltiorrhiza]